jgi:hypothetical protein
MGRCSGLFPEPQLGSGHGRARGRRLGWDMAADRRLGFRGGHQRQRPARAKSKQSAHLSHDGTMAALSAMTNGNRSLSPTGSQHPPLSTPMPSRRSLRMGGATAGSASIEDSLWLTEVRRVVAANAEPIPGDRRHLLIYFDHHGCLEVIATDARLGEG